MRWSSIVCVGSVLAGPCWPVAVHGKPPATLGETNELTLDAGECTNFARLPRRLPSDAEALSRRYRIRVDRSGSFLRLRLTTIEAGLGGASHESVETVRLMTCEEALEWTAFTLGLLLDGPDPKEPTTPHWPRDPTASVIGGSDDATVGTDDDETTPLTWDPADNLMFGIGAGFDSSAPSGSAVSTTLLAGLRWGHLRPTVFGDWWVPGSASTSLPSQGPVQWQQWAVGAALCADGNPAWLAARSRLGFCLGSRLNGLELQTEAAAIGAAERAQWVSVDLSLLAGYELAAGFGLELAPTLRVNPKPPSIKTGPGHLRNRPGTVEGHIHLALVWQATPSSSGNPR